jgi:hypothetical protein
MKIYQLATLLTGHIQIHLSNISGCVILVLGSKFGLRRRFVFVYEFFHGYLLHYILGFHLTSWAQNLKPRYETSLLHRFKISYLWMLETSCPSAILVLGNRCLRRPIGAHRVGMFACRSVNQRNEKLQGTIFIVKTALIYTWKKPSSRKQLSTSTLFSSLHTHRCRSG